MLYSILLLMTGSDPKRPDTEIGQKYTPSIYRNEYRISSSGNTAKNQVLSEGEVIMVTLY